MDNDQSERDVVECNDDDCDIESQKKYMEQYDDEWYCGFHIIKVSEE